MRRCLLNLARNATNALRYILVLKVVGLLKKKLIGISNMKSDELLDEIMKTTLNVVFSVIWYAMSLW